LGLIRSLSVQPADRPDGDGAKWVLQKVAVTATRLTLIWADDGYAGKLIAWVKDICGWRLEIVKRSDDVKGFKVVPKRWIVERTFAWLYGYRRLSKDYEYLVSSSENMIYIAMIQLMLRRLAMNST
jgi:putative transposase